MSKWVILPETIIWTAPAQADGAEPEDAVEWAERILGFRLDEAQARVLRSRSKRVILNCTRQWGKSTVTALKAVHQAITEPGTLTVVVSACERQSGEFVRKASRFARALNSRVKGDGDNRVSLAFENGSRIVGLPSTEGTVRGFSAVSLLVIDEASRAADELYHAVRPMLAVSGGSLWLISTPFGKRGFFYETWDHGSEDWERVKVTAEGCPRIPAAFLEEERRALGERVFRQEYLCEFVETGGGVFDVELVEKAVRDDVAPLEIE